MNLNRGLDVLQTCGQYFAFIMCMCIWYISVCDTLLIQVLLLSCVLECTCLPLRTHFSSHESRSSKIHDDPYGTCTCYVASHHVHSQGRAVGHVVGRESERTCVCVCRCCGATLFERVTCSRKACGHHVCARVVMWVHNMYARTCGPHVCVLSW